MLRGKGTGVDRALVVIFLASSIFAGLVTGWLGGCVGTLVLASIGFVRVRRRVPAIPVASIVLAMVFLQGGKSAFRERFWYQNEQAGAFKKARYWIEMSVERSVVQGLGRGCRGACIDAVVAGKGVGDGLREYAVAGALSIWLELRVPVDHADPTIPVAGQTVGESTQPLLSGCLRRDAGRRSRPRRHRRRADSGGLYEFRLGGNSAGHGAAGIVLGIFERVLLGRNAGTFASAVGLANVLQLLALNGQAAAYLGGMVQIVGLTIMIFLPGCDGRIDRRGCAGA